MPNTGKLIQEMLENERVLKARSSYLLHKSREYLEIPGSKRTRYIYKSHAVQMAKLGNTLLWQSLLIEKYRLSVLSLGKTHTAWKEALKVCSSVLTELTLPPSIPPLEEPEVVLDLPTAPTTDPRSKTLASAEPEVRCGAISAEMRMALSSI